MKKFKFIKRVIFAGILGISPLLAEESGWFAGAQFGGGGVELVYEYCSGYSSGTTSCYTDPQEQDFEGYRWGLLGGYKQFFTPKFGLRYYGSFNMGPYNYDGTAYNSNNRTDIRTTFTNKLDEYTFHLHIDALYNFITNESTDFGVFGGVGLGYVWYKYTIKEGTQNAIGEKGYSQIDTARDFDIRFLAGLRVNLAKRHGIEVFIQLPVLKQEKTFAVFTGGNHFTATGNTPQYTAITLTNTPSSSLGIRYTFSF